MTTCAWIAALLLSSPLEGELAAVPDADALAEARREVLALFEKGIESARSREEKTALCRKMLKTSLETGRASAEHYVLLRLVIDVACEAGDLSTALQAVDRVADFFAIDILSAKFEALEKVAPEVDDPLENRALLGEILSLFEEALRLDRYDAARDLGKVAIVAARKSEDRNHWTMVRTRLRDIDDIERAHDAMRKSLDPGLAPAELAALSGAFLCFDKGDWSRGVPLLAQGGDPAIQALATAECAGPATPVEQADLADAWWARAEEWKGLRRRNTAMHAAQWYKRALPELTGLTKVLVEKKLLEIGNVLAKEPIHARGKMHAVADDRFWLRLNGAQIMKSVRNCTSPPDYPVTVWAGDVICVLLTNARPPHMGFGMRFYDENGRDLFQHSPDWRIVNPRDKNAWWVLTPDEKDERCVIADSKGLIWGKKSPSYLYHVVSPIELLPPPTLVIGAKGYPPRVASETR
ncbi:MAG: hypothetical protein JXA90_13360 [Planctomycetes bacterium]|nr:hypothetical protein [Planctomycetota bacterium]